MFLNSLFSSFLGIHSAYLKETPNKVLMTIFSLDNWRIFLRNIMLSFRLLYNDYQQISSIYAEYDTN